MTEPGEPRYRIGDAAEAAGVTPRTIRYYEEIGLLGAAADRLKGSHRLYSDADVERLRELVRLRDLLGVSLDELTRLADTMDVRANLRDRWAATTDDAERVRIIEAAIDNVERQLELVRSRQSSLAEFEAERSDKLADLRRQLASLSPSPAGTGRGVTVRRERGMSAEPEVVFNTATDPARIAAWLPAPLRAHPPLADPLRASWRDGSGWQALLSVEDIDTGGALAVLELTADGLDESGLTRVAEQALFDLDREVADNFTAG